MFLYTYASVVHSVVKMVGIRLSGIPADRSTFKFIKIVCTAVFMALHFAKVTQVKAASENMKNSKFYNSL